MASAVASNLLPAAAPPPAVPAPYGWLAPRASFSRDASTAAAEVGMAVDPVVAATTTTPEPAISKDFIDFEFSLGGSATMLPADELFADGKLLPLRKPAAAAAEAAMVSPPLPDPAAAAPAAEQPEEAMPAAAPPSSTEPIKPLRAAAVTAAAVDGADPYAFSPKAPSCSSRWRELLGLKRAAAAAAAHTPTSRPSPSPTAARTPGTAARAANSAAARSLKLLLQRNTAAGRTASGGASAASELASAPLLLLRDSSDSEASLSLASSRFSLSSSSSSSGGHDHDDVPRFSLDSSASAAAMAAAGDPNPPRIRLVRRSSHSHSQHRHSTSSTTTTTSQAGRSPGRRRRPSPPPGRCGSSVDSPRMNSSGKVVFQGGGGGGLERSSSSPCSFNAASKARSSRAGAVDRSYSSGVGRVAAPVVLNVPSMCSRPVFGFFKDRKDAAAKDAAAAKCRSSSALGRKAQAWSGELARSSAG